jgi:hypothetical protein
MKYCNDGMNTKRKNVNRGLMDEILELCNLFLINLNFS